MNKDDGVVLRPMNDKVIVETVVIVETDGGLLLPEIARDKPQEGVS